MFQIITQISSSSKVCLQKYFVHFVLIQFMQSFEATDPPPGNQSASRYICISACFLNVCRKEAGEDIQHTSGGAKNEAMTNGGGKDLSRVIVGNLARRLTKDLCKRLSKNHTGRRSRDLAKDSPGSTPGGSPGTAPGCSPGASPGGSPGTSPGCRPGPSPGGTPGIPPGRSPGGLPGCADEPASGGLCRGWGTDVHKKGTS